MAYETAASIAEGLEADITSGTLLPGDRLVPVRQLAAQLHVSPATVASAYRRLRERGIVTGRGRQGSIVASSVQPLLTQVVPVPEGIIDALRGSPDPRLLPELGPAFAVATAQPQAHYGDGLVDPTLATAAREIFGRDGVPADHIVVTSGAMDAVERVISAQGLRRGSRIGVEDPGHVPVHQLVRSAGMELVPLAIDQEGLTPAALRAALTAGLDALIVTPRCQNPTGAAFSRDRATTLSAMLEPHPDLVLIQDDHAGMVSGVDYHGLTPPGERHATVRSLGKSFGPDLRLALVAADTYTHDRMSVAISNGPGWVSHLLQRAAAHLLTDEDTVVIVANAAQSYRDRRQRLIDRLDAHDVIAHGTSGLNVWIPTLDEQLAVEAARGAGFAIRAADTYRIRSGPAVRVTVSNLDNNHIDALVEALAASRLPQTAHSLPM